MEGSFVRGIAYELSVELPLVWDSDSGGLSFAFNADGVVTRCGDDDELQVGDRIVRVGDMEVVSSGRKVSWAEKWKRQIRPGARVVLERVRDYKEGYLSKKGNIHRAFKRRFFRLVSEAAEGNRKRVLLTYSRDRDAAAPLGRITLNDPGTSVVEHQNYATRFYIHSLDPPRKYSLSADSKGERDGWVAHLNGVLDRVMSVRKEGWLEKRGKGGFLGNTSYKARYFRFGMGGSGGARHRRDGALSFKYFRDDRLGSKSLGTVPFRVDHTSISVDTKDSRCFAIVTHGHGRVFELRARDRAGRDAWVDVLRDALRMLKPQVRKARVRTTVNPLAPPLPAKVRSSIWFTKHHLSKLAYQEHAAAQRAYIRRHTMEVKVPSNLISVGTADDSSTQSRRQKESAPARPAAVGDDLSTHHSRELSGITAEASAEILTRFFSTLVKCPDRKRRKVKRIKDGTSNTARADAGTGPVDEDSNRSLNQAICEKEMILWDMASSNCENIEVDATTASHILCCSDTPVPAILVGAPVFRGIHTWELTVDRISAMSHKSMDGPGTAAISVGLTDLSSDLRQSPRSSGSTRRSTVVMSSTPREHRHVNWGCRSNGFVIGDEKARFSALRQGDVVKLSVDMGKKCLRVQVQRAGAKESISDYTTTDIAVGAAVAPCVELCGLGTLVTMRRSKEATQSAPKPDVSLTKKRKSLLKAQQWLFFKATALVRYLNTCFASSDDKNTPAAATEQSSTVSKPVSKWLTPIESPVDLLQRSRDGLLLARILNEWFPTAIDVRALNTRAINRSSSLTMRASTVPSATAQSLGEDSFTSEERSSSSVATGSESTSRSGEHVVSSSTKPPKWIQSELTLGAIHENQSLVLQSCASAGVDVRPASPQALLYPFLVDPTIPVDLFWRVVIRHLEDQNTALGTRQAFTEAISKQSTDESSSSRQRTQSLVIQWANWALSVAFEGQGALQDALSGVDRMSMIATHMRDLTAPTARATLLILVASIATQCSRGDKNAEAAIANAVRTSLSDQKALGDISRDTAQKTVRGLLREGLPPAAQARINAFLPPVAPAAALKADRRLQGDMCEAAAASLWGAVVQSLMANSADLIFPLPVPQASATGSRDVKQEVSREADGRTSKETMPISGSEKRSAVTTWTNDGEPDQNNVLNTEEHMLQTWVDSVYSFSVADMFKNGADGVALGRLIDAVMPKHRLIDWKSMNLSPSDRHHRIANCHAVVRACRAPPMSLPLENISGVDLCNGTRKLVLAFLWQLMERHLFECLGELFEHMTSRASAHQRVSNLSQTQGTRQQSTVSEVVQVFDEKTMIEWANTTISEAQTKLGLPDHAVEVLNVESRLTVSDLKDAKLADGVYLCALCWAIGPDSVDWSNVVPAKTHVERVQNAKYALSVAQKLGATIFALPVEIVKLRKRKLILLIGSLLALTAA